MLLSVHQQIIDLLKRDTNLMDKISGVYEYVPENPTYPFVVVTGGNSIPLQTTTSRGETATLIIEAYSSKSYEELKNVWVEVEKLLMNQVITFTDYGEVMCSFMKSTIAYDRAKLYKVSMQMNLDI
ncbi:DUF3168 domain-containing protein [Hazenella sp. IB182353]|uniref:tail completion protein gp17 n=1 Tax=Polycladospora coralii TaxID=2771432 RepID=UPI0017470F68|nr:DUF3168 domain-containing protein [Polycladospora coralii]MBS7531372.1 DUF3168 domain-containing protein [Polycladospora coralii]